ncbi:MAG: hypothetical protein EAZ47_10150 [Bacteroidetes bacterium]|nr:MAG: hypothetical protein EAY68_03875 [Bacteroidota bacterium]TAF91258.1 MAG: hypothetical protein EAZ47_10150 [Bacteroidota bacterium]
MVYVFVCFSLACKIIKLYAKTYNKVHKTCLIIGFIELPPTAKHQKTAKHSLYARPHVFLYYVLRIQWV